METMARDEGAFNGKKKTRSVSPCGRFDVDSWHSAWQNFSDDETDRLPLAIPTNVGDSSDPDVSSRSLPMGLELSAARSPSYELFRLRTGCVLHRHLGAGRYIVDANLPHAIVVHQVRSKSENPLV